MSIRSADSEPLLMEAHQALGASIKTDCCRAMRVEVLNADNRAGAIYLEILLRETTTKEFSTESLGSEVMPSSEVRPISPDRGPVDESLTFLFPTDLHEKQFNEITVVVRTARERARMGARIAIRQFVLVPRE